MTERSLKSVPRRQSSSGRSSPKAEQSDRRVSAAAAAKKAKEQLQELLGVPAERVTAVNRLDQGWAVTVEVLELRRVPETMDVLGVYEVELTRRGQVTGWRRASRHYRSDVEGS